MLLKKSKVVSIVMSVVLGIGMLFMPTDIAVAATAHFAFTNVSSTKVIQRDSTFSLKYKVSSKYKKKKIVWKTSDKTIASVSAKGNIKARKDGTATVSAYVSGHKKLTDSVLVTVRKNVSKVELTGISSKEVLSPGDTVQLMGRALPTNASVKDITWEIDNSNVATVDPSGLLTAVADGSATVTARSVDRKTVYKSIKFYVGVKTAEVTLTGKTILRKGRKTTISTNVSPTTATYKAVSWKSSNKKVATVSSTGVVKGKKNGTVTITATTKDGTNNKSSLKIRVLSVSRNEVKFIAHRGYSDIAPENTASAFELAGEEGFWGPECDVWETRHTLPAVDVNGVAADEKTTFDLVIQHDDTFQRMCGNSAYVRNLTADEVKQLSVIGGSNAADYNEKVCFFSTYLGICKDYSMTPVVELKDPYMTDAGVEKTIDMLHESGLLGKAVIVSFYTNNLDRAIDYAINKYNTKLNTSYVIGTKYMSGYDAYSRISSLGNKYTGISLRRNCMTGDIDAYCKANGIKLSLWPYNSRSLKDLYSDVHTYAVDSVTVNGKLFN